jgi:hypothetical protein
MRKIRDVLRLRHEANLSHKQIALGVGISKGAVAKYLSLSEAHGLTWPLPDDLDDAALELRLFPVADRPVRLVEPDFPTIHQELKRKGVTLQLLWSEYAIVHGDRAYQYSRYCDLYRAWAGRQKRSMRQQHQAGEKLFIDYCGPTVDVIDHKTGEVRQAQIFVAVLGASNYTFAEATWSQGLPDWIASHQRGLRFFDGVPALLVPDYVPGNIIWVMWPRPLCGGGASNALFSRRSPGTRQHNDYSDFSHSRSDWSSRQMGLRGSLAEVVIGGLQASSACAFMRRVISA